MGITQAAVHLPTRRLADKELAQLDIGGGFRALRVPWWDEDPLTMAVEAGLRLGEAVERAEQLVLALDAVGQDGALAALALGVGCPVSELAGPDAGLEVLATADPGVPTLILAGGGDAHTGGAGVALLLEPGEGVDPGGTASTEGASEDPASRVGQAGAAGGLLDLAAGLQGPLPVHGLDAPVHDIDAGAWRSLTQTTFEPWAEASQGAYVSMEQYEADPVQRYGARATGPGEVVAVTTIRAGPPGEFVRQHEAAGPYDVAIVALDAGGRAIGQGAAPPGALAIGDRVRPVLRLLFSMEGRWRYALKWWPVEG